jgi:hypothetical protein
MECSFAMRLATYDVRVNIAKRSSAKGWRRSKRRGLPVWSFAQFADAVVWLGAPGEASSGPRMEEGRPRQLAVQLRVPAREEGVLRTRPRRNPQPPHA